MCWWTLLLLRLQGVGTPKIAVLPHANLEDATDSDVSDGVDEDCDDLLDGQDLDDSESDDMLIGPSVDLVSIHSPKRVRI